MEYFTDDDIQFLGANFSEEHAKAARWFGEGRPGLGRATRPAIRRPTPNGRPVP
jgi:hypothetical protein